MKKYLAIFNLRTFVVLALALLSCFISLHYKISTYIDFLIIGLLIAFPITLTIKEAFKRRERALQYLSLFKASLQSVFYSIQTSKIDQEEKEVFRGIATDLTNQLCQYLLSADDEHTGRIHKASEQIALFVNGHKKKLKSSLANKILLFLFRLNESLEFVIATKRHQTPRILRLVVLFAIVLFPIFYPPALLHEVGFDVSFLYLFAMTGFKSLLLISLYNVQRLLENPFNQEGTDGIRVGDFVFTAGDFPVPLKKEKENKEEEDIDENILE